MMRSLLNINCASRVFSLDARYVWVDVMNVKTKTPSSSSSSYLHSLPSIRETSEPPEHIHQNGTFWSVTHSKSSFYRYIDRVLEWTCILWIVSLLLLCILGLWVRCSVMSDRLVSSTHKTNEERKRQFFLDNDYTSYTSVEDAPAITSTRFRTKIGLPFHEVSEIRNILSETSPSLTTASIDELIEVRTTKEVKRKKLEDFFASLSPPVEPGWLSKMKTSVVSRIWSLIMPPKDAEIRAKSERYRLRRNLSRDTHSQVSEPYVQEPTWVSKMASGISQIWSSMLHSKREEIQTLLISTVSLVTQPFEYL